MQPLLELKNICYSYHTPTLETPAIANLSFALYPGEFLAVVGPSGCGKSTLLSIICGLLNPEKGLIMLNGRYLHSDSSSNIGYMLQHDHLFEWRTIFQNVTLGLEIQHTLCNRTKAHAEELLECYGLKAFKNARPSELSGGMRQRAALIRTLVLDPELLLLDEPFSSLDYQTRLSVGDDIGQILRKEKKSAILVTHDLSEAISLADRIIVLTKRPATIQSVVPVSFALADDTPMHRRNAPEFKTYFNQIWEALNHDA
ncbi:ABC transporter ATP-binding protein [Hespellia stercorisuis]|uniref:NitT/TauT family transport system ATP-binding protein n=1 Tax=Hespellia stercorisuis DSM 15480 TaxID=1121950 RepID=A0A1M6NPX0_9FIRM|nr:ABC transporter ATP-binding protein [Hespellia stercorisuis]SHJ97797.1 NitT/TauT family transport system ATP-binding protein [Hespellia stercorisuis DSM 15480]